jgi:phosphomannomutase
MSKNKITLEKGMNVDDLLLRMKERYATERISTIDGVKIDFEESWVHLRKSNTEPIIRIYTEATSEAQAVALANRFVTEISSLS